MGIRHKARILAFQTIYSWDFEKKDIGEVYRSVSALSNTKFKADAEAFVRLIVFGIVENIEAIDRQISENAKNWNFDRLSKVDLAILRTGVYGLMFQKETDGSIIINEAVDIAKEFGGDESYKFVNGVLDSVYKKMKKSDVPGK